MFSLFDPDAVLHSLVLLVLGADHLLVLGDNVFKLFGFVLLQLKWLVLAYHGAHFRKLVVAVRCFEL
jgi:hypothetical protein